MTLNERGDRAAWPVEPKVKAAAAGSGAGAVSAGFVLWLLDAYVFRAGDVPAAVVALVLLVVPVALAFVAGYLAPHMPRPVTALRFPTE